MTGLLRLLTWMNEVCLMAICFVRVNILRQQFDARFMRHNSTDPHMVHIKHEAPCLKSKDLCAFLPQGLHALMSAANAQARILGTILPLLTSIHYKALANDRPPVTPEILHQCLLMNSTSLQGHAAVTLLQQHPWKFRVSITS